MAANENITSGFDSLGIMDDRLSGGSLRRAYNWMAKKLQADPAAHHRGLFMPAFVLCAETHWEGKPHLPPRAPVIALAASFVAHSTLIEPGFKNIDLVDGFSAATIRTVREIQKALAGEARPAGISRDARLSIIAAGIAELEVNIEHYAGKALDKADIPLDQLPGLMKQLPPGMDIEDENVTINGLPTRRETLARRHAFYAARHLPMCGTGEQDLENRLIRDIRTIEAMSKQVIAPRRAAGFN